MVNTVQETWPKLIVSLVYKAKHLRTSKPQGDLLWWVDSLIFSGSKVQFLGFSKKTIYKAFEKTIHEALLRSKVKINLFVQVVNNSCRWRVCEIKKVLFSNKHSVGNQEDMKTIIFLTYVLGNPRTQKTKSFFKKQGCMSSFKKYRRKICCALVKVSFKTK